MRQAAVVLALAIGGFESPPANAQDASRDSSLETCVAAAGASRVALERCKGALAEPCIEAPGGETTAGMAQCYNAEAQAWSAQLDAAIARGRTDAARAGFLNQAQEAWRAWREAECQYQASLYQGGTLARVVVSSCAADLTADRAIALISAERRTEE